jgi:hypothetical protein
MKYSAPRQDTASGDATIAQGASRQAASSMSLPSIEEVRKLAASRHQARLARASLNRPVAMLPPSPPRHAVESLLSSSGTNIAQLQNLRDEYRSEMRKLADQNAAKAISQSTSLEHSLAATLAAKSQAAQFVPLVPEPDIIAIPTPFLIWSSLGVQLDSYQIQPYNNWAKLKYQATSDGPGGGSGEVTFYFFWENPRSVDTVFNVDSVMGVHGHLEADDDTGFWVFSHEATDLNISLQLECFNWSQSETSSIGFDIEYPASLSAYGPGWPISVGAIITQDVLRGYDLGATSLIVHPGQLMVFELVMTMQYSMGDGAIDVDFSSGAFQAYCPYVIINITS